MNWIKENPFLSGLLGVVVVVGGGLAFLLFQSMSAFQLASDDYTAAVQKLQSLQNMVPFPNEENLAKAKALQAAYEKEVKNFHQQLNALEIPLPTDMTPQKFQDELRNAVDRAKKNATAAGLPFLKISISVSTSIAPACRARKPRLRSLASWRLSATWFRN